jgi:hypothetical protein
VSELQGSYQLTIVDAENKAHLKTVQVGQQVGNDWLINGGLEPNDQVVIEGLQSAKEGTVVDPQPYKPGATNNAAPVTKP